MKFAHISDSHIGAWRDPILREINDRAFGKTIELCIEKKVDFVVISGDIFDTGLPEMGSVRSAVRKLRKLNENNIRTYVVYGSHDYSPTTVSVVDVLTSAGLFTNVGEYLASESDALELRTVLDEKTGAQIAGLPGRRGGLEKNFYEKNDLHFSKDDDKFSVFVFHASINELQSLNIPLEESVSIQQLPKGFSYYAGGHIHKRLEGNLYGSPVVYPGPLFGTSFPDLETVAKGEKRGFAIVEFEGSKTTKVEFVDLELPKILMKSISAEARPVEQVEKEISDFVSKDSLNVSDAIVLLKVRGTLNSGRSSDIDWYQYRQKLIERGASVVNINRLGLQSQESKKLVDLKAHSKDEIESKLLEQHLKDYKPQTTELEHLSSNSGVQVASRILKLFKAERKEEETKQDFEGRIWKEASSVLKLPTEEFEN